MIPDTSLQLLRLLLDGLQYTIVCALLAIAIRLFYESKVELYPLTSSISAEYIDNTWVDFRYISYMNYS